MGDGGRWKVDRRQAQKDASRCRWKRGESTRQQHQSAAAATHRHGDRRPCPCPCPSDPWVPWGPSAPCPCPFPCPWGPSVPWGPCPFPLGPLAPSAPCPCPSVPSAPCPSPCPCPWDPCPCRPCPYGRPCRPCLPYHRRRRQGRRRELGPCRAACSLQTSRRKEEEQASGSHERRAERAVETQQRRQRTRCTCTCSSSTASIPRSAREFTVSRICRQAGRHRTHAPAGMWVWWRGSVAPGPYSGTGPVPGCVAGRTRSCRPMYTKPSISSAGGGGGTGGQVQAGRQAEGQAEVKAGSGAGSGAHSHSHGPCGRRQKPRGKGVAASAAMPAAALRSRKLAGGAADGLHSAAAAKLSCDSQFAPKSAAAPAHPAAVLLHGRAEAPETNAAAQQTQQPANPTSAHGARSYSRGVSVMKAGVRLGTERIRVQAEFQCAIRKPEVVVLCVRSKLQGGTGSHGLALPIT